MEDGGSSALTPEMVLAAARPPLEALGARSGRASGSNEGFMGLDGAGAEALAPEQEPRRDRLSRPGGAATSVATAQGAPAGDERLWLGSSGLSPPGAPGAVPWAPRKPMFPLKKRLLFHLARPTGTRRPRGAPPGS